MENSVSCSSKLCLRVVGQNWPFYTAPNHFCIRSQRSTLSPRKISKVDIKEKTESLSFKPHIKRAISKSYRICISSKGFLKVLFISANFWNMGCNSVNANTVILCTIALLFSAEVSSSQSHTHHQPLQQKHQDQPMNWPVTLTFHETKTNASKLCWKN